MSAPGHSHTAKAISRKNGLKDGDYTIDQLDMGQYVNAMTVVRSMAAIRSSPTRR